MYIPREPKAILADNLRLYRKKKALSQEALAQKANMTRTHVGSIEQECGNPTLGCLTKLANALDIEVEDLLSRRHPARYGFDWGRSLVHQSPEVVIPDDFAPGDYAICHWDNDQLIMTPLMVEDKELIDFLVSYLIMNGETEGLSAKASFILEAVKAAAQEATQKTIR